MKIGSSKLGDDGDRGLSLVDVKVLESERAIKLASYFVLKGV